MTGQITIKEFLVTIAIGASTTSLGFGAHTVVYSNAMDPDLLSFGSKNRHSRSTCGIVRGRVFKLKP